MSEQVKALPIQNSTHASPISWRDYLELTKPRVVALMILTSVIGMLLAAPGVPGWSVLLFGNLGIALLAGAAAVVNHVVDQKIDTVMARTRKRPVATGRIATLDALLFATVLAALGMVVLVWQVNELTAWLTLALASGGPLRICIRFDEVGRLGCLLPEAAAGSSERTTIVIGSTCPASM